MNKVAALLAEATLASLHHNGCLGRDFHAAVRDVRAEVEIFHINVDDATVMHAARLVTDSPINQRKARLKARYHSETSALHRNSLRAVLAAIA